jgi:phospho-N-acetylmuramoyl-pentapeptide-transferase
VSLPVILDLVTVVVAFAVCAAAYPFVIRGLRRLRMEQVIQPELPAEHHRKAGTPTGGGILFVAVGVIGGLLSLRMHTGGLPGVAGLLLYGLLGLWDDLTKLRVGSRGIPARLKLPIQVVLAIPVAWLAHAPQHGIPSAWAWAYWPLAVLLITGFANAVNLTDGIDGLAGGAAVIAVASCTLLLPGATAGEKAVAMTLTGALLAFLLYNRHPARVFMGDTGSLGVGAALAAMALQQGWGFLLLPLGLVFVAEAGSVMIQVSYFKATGGRRMFPNTPIHLTFQQEGWSENRIALTFWGAGVAAALASGWIAHVVT